MTSYQFIMVKIRQNVLFGRKKDILECQTNVPHHLLIYQHWAIIIAAFLQIRPKGHREPCNQVGSLSLVEFLMDFEQRIFRFYLQRFSPLDHSPQIRSLSHSPLSHYVTHQLFHFGTVSKMFVFPSASVFIFCSFFRTSPITFG